MSESPERKFPLKPIDVELASDADLNNVWEDEGESPSPRQRLTVEEAYLAQTEELDPGDISPPSPN